VEAHPDPNLGAVRPRLRREVALGVDRGSHAPGNLGEDREDAVALGLLLVPAGRPDRRPDDLAVAGEERGPGVDRQRLRELRGALDVGEQKGDGPDGLGARRSLRLGLSDAVAP
jgi:hypothetical protein